MNSSYGTLVMKSFDSVFQFVSEEKFERDYDETVTPITEVNGKIFCKYKNKCHHDNNKPIQLGAFILAYSRVKMNELFVEMGAFYKHVIKYSDTDSAYVGKEQIPAMERSGLLGNELGQFKNDYGDGLYIVKFVCVGKKMKICLLSNGEITLTMKGYKWLSKLDKVARRELLSIFERVIESRSEEVFKEILFETMKRSGLQVNVMQMTRSFKMTAYTQYKIDKKYRCYPLYYRFDEDQL
jgi:hypothetical protein